MLFFHLFSTFEKALYSSIHTSLQFYQALTFPVIMGAIFMYLFAVGGTYFLGIHMGLLAVGAYIAMAGDECARAIGMVLRWKSGKWKSKSLIEL